MVKYELWLPFSCLHTSTISLSLSASLSHALLLCVVLCVCVCFLDGTSTRYIHLGDVYVAVNDVVEQGESIGLSSQTGYTCGSGTGGK